MGSGTSGGGGAAGIRIAKQGIEVARKNYDLSNESLLFHVAEVYYGRLEAQKNLDALEALPEDLPGAIQQLSDYEFLDPEAGREF